MTPLLPLRKSGRTQAWSSIQSMGHTSQPWERTTSTIAMPRRPSYRRTRAASSGVPAVPASAGSVRTSSDMGGSVVAVRSC